MGNYPQKENPLLIEKRSAHRDRAILRVLILLLGILIGFSSQSPSHAGIFNPKTYTAKNDLQVVVLENHRAPVVTQALWYKVGTLDDPQGKTGLAHYLEHMMFKGKPGSPSESISREVTQVGGQLNAGTSSDFTCYYETVAVQHLDKIMKLESSRMKNLQILEGQAQTERDVVLEERRSRVENDPLGKMEEILDAVSFIRHPYGSPRIGWEQDIRALTPKDLRAFHHRWYHPGNAILIIAGDVTLDQVKKLVSKYYEPIARSPQEKRHWMQDPPRTNLKHHLEYSSSHIQSPYFYRRYWAPHPKTHKPEEVYATEVLVSYLTETGTGYLYRRLVEERRVASSISISFSDFSLDPMPLTVFAQPTPGHTVQELEMALDEELRLLLSEKRIESDIEKVKDRMLAHLVYAKDNAFAGASHFGLGLCLGKTLEELDNWDQFIKKVTLAQVEQAARTIFGTPYHLTAYLTPQKPSKETH